MSSWGLFDAYGVELEYMIVDRQTLDVKPVADEVLKTAGGGGYVTDVERDALEWSNELVLHVIELKTADPVRRLNGVAGQFQNEVREINRLLAPLGGRLMPGATHPWMDPHQEMRLWPHGYNPIYETYHRIFNCSGHGWANLQAVHLNLPFSTDDEFARLHAAVRFLLPILPALAAGSPYQDGAFTGRMDSRMEAYRSHVARIPSVAGRIIPEAIRNPAEYRTLLQGIYDDLAPHDPKGTLRYEWVNARGAITRFDRNAIEIRVLDVQENPKADLAICALIVAVLKALLEERWVDFKTLQQWPMASLESVLWATVEQAGKAPMLDKSYVQALGWDSTLPCSAAELWRNLWDSVEDLLESDAEIHQALEFLMERGSLSQRLFNRCGEKPHREGLRAILEELCDCLETGTFLDG